MGGRNGLRDRVRARPSSARALAFRSRGPRSCPSTTTTRQNSCRSRAAWPELGFRLVATRRHGRVACWARPGRCADRSTRCCEGRPNAVDLMKNGEIQLILNTPLGTQSPTSTRRRCACAATQRGIPLVDDAVGGATPTVEAIRERPPRGRSEVQDAAGDLREAEAKTLPDAASVCPRSLLQQLRGAWSSVAHDGHCGSRARARSHARGPSRARSRSPCSARPGAKSREQRLHRAVVEDRDVVHAARSRRSARRARAPAPGDAPAP